MEVTNTFKIVLNSDYKNNTTLLHSSKEEVLKITSEPKHVYEKWYHKLLNKITFGNRFCEGWEHSVEKISK